MPWYPFNYRTIAIKPIRFRTGHLFTAMEMTMDMICCIITSQFGFQSPHWSYSTHSNWSSSWACWGAPGGCGHVFPADVESDVRSANSGRSTLPCATSDATWAKIACNFGCIPGTGISTHSNHLTKHNSVNKILSLG